MLWLTIGLALLAAAAAIYFVVRPLFQPPRSLHETDDSPLGELIARKDAVLLNIKETEFDYRTGKLNEEDYQRYTHRLRQQAVSLIKRIDQLAPDAGNLEAELEAAVAGQRLVADRSPAAVAPPLQIGSATYCHHCGAMVQPEDNFCGACGTKLRTAVPA